MTVIRTNLLRPAVQRRLENALLVPVVALLAVGLLMVFSTSFASGLSGGGLEALRPLLKHLVGLCLGGLLLALCVWAPLPWLRSAAPWLLAVCVAALVAVFIPGVAHSVSGHRRWISFLGWQFQPSEFAKVALMLFLAAALGNRVQANRRGRDTSLLGPLTAVGAALLLVAAEPNFATAAVMGLVVLTLLYLAGERAALLFGLTLAAAVLLVLTLQLTPDKWERVLAFFGKGGLAAHARGVGYQTTQSVRALGAGGLVGWGLGTSSAKFGALPFANTDFVFSVLGQETGFVGCLVVLAAYMFLGINGLAIGQRTRAPFPALLIGGLAMMLALQALVNIAIAVSWCIPMGVPLPFVSCGGSSLAASLAAVGLMINCARYGQASPRGR